MDRFTQMEVFLKTAELGSLSRAAEVLGMSPAAASRYLGALEERVGARLVERNTRRLWLTEAGQAFLSRSAPLLAELAEAEAAVTAHAVAPQGVLRVTSSLSFATIYIAPMLADLHRLYPKLGVQIVVANRYLDFIEAGIDVAIRTRLAEPETGIVVRRLGRMRRVLAAAPAYLDRQGLPEDPDDLIRHDMLVYNLAVDPLVLSFVRDEEARTVRITATLDCNDGQVIRQAALAGLGILIQPLYIVAEDIRAGRLVQILPDWQMPPLTMNIAYQNRTYLPAKIRVFSDALVGWVRRRSGSEVWMS